LWAAEYVSRQIKSSWGKNRGAQIPGYRSPWRQISTVPSNALVLSLFAPTPPVNFNHYLICAHFRFNALSLAAFYYPKSLFLTGI